MQSQQKLVIILSTLSAIALVGDLSPFPVIAQTPATAPARRSSLPDAALKLAQQAEKHLAANEPEKAITILRDLDKQYPNQSPISLRLAQINDTLNRNGYALFYYRRYIKQAGPQARDIAVERVTTLELMAGTTAEAETAARELGETTTPVATPQPKIERQLVTEAKDGSRVPINNEKDLERLQRQGVPKTAPSTPVPTPAPAYVIPAELTAARPSIPMQAQTQAPARPRQSDPKPQMAASPAPRQDAAPPAAQASVYAKATPRPPDEDALMAKAFSRGDNLVQPDPPDRPPPSYTPERNNPPARSTPPPPMAFTRRTPVHESARAAGFFNIAQGAGPQARIALVNDLPDAVVAFSLTPEDSGEVISAILLPGEKRTLLIKPARYDLTANASTNDYSPVTLMNTDFKYTFEAGRQYTRRFNKTSLEQVN